MKSDDPAHPEVGSRRLRWPPTRQSKQIWAVARLRKGALPSRSSEPGGRAMSTTTDVSNSIERPVRPSDLAERPKERGGGWFEMVRRAVHTHTILADSLLAFALLAFSTVWLVHSPFFGRNAALVQTSLIVPLVWRRVRPFTVFVVMSGVAFLQLVLGYQLIGDAALLLGLYTVAVHATRIRLVLAASLLEFGAVMAAIHWEPAG